MILTDAAFIFAANCLEPHVINTLEQGSPTPSLQVAGECARLHLHMHRV